VSACLFAVLALGGMLWVNGGFGGWHAGWTIGPRYLSPTFPALALLAALLWDRVPRYARVAIWAGLAVSLVFRWLLLPFTVVLPIAPLWPSVWTLLATSRVNGPYIHLGVAALASAITVWFTVRAQHHNASGLTVAAAHLQER
jgi:hypothetical protein